MKVFDLERTGTSLHVWVGPFGMHLWRYSTPYDKRPITFDFDWEWPR